MQGGINNAALFGASQRSARSKLDQMAGIKRPSGILASSPELMQAAMPYQPPMPQSPASMVGAPMAPPMMYRLPYMPMPTSVAPRSLNPMAPDPVVPQPASPNTPMRFKPGGDVSVAPDDARQTTEGGLPVEDYQTYYGNSNGTGTEVPPQQQQSLDINQQLRDARQSLVAERLDITMDSGKFKSFLKGLPYLGIKFLEETIGDEAAIAQVAQRKLNNIEAAAKSKDPAQTADQVMVEAGEKPTAAAKMDFAKNVLGLDINDIDEINRRIDNVVVGSAVGKGPDEFAAAVLMGLQAFKQTASARAAASTAAGGEKSRQEYLYKSVFDATYKAALEVDPENAAAALAAARQAAATAAPNAPSATMGGQPAPTDRGLPSVSTQAEYDALPSGAEFTQNGQKRKKP